MREGGDLGPSVKAGQPADYESLRMPDETRIRKGCNRAERCTVVTYGDRAPPIWWEKLRSSVQRFENLTVLHLPEAVTLDLASSASRGLDWQVTIQDGTTWISVDGRQIEVRPSQWR